MSELEQHDQAKLIASIITMHNDIKSERERIEQIVNTNSWFDYKDEMELRIKSDVSWYMRHDFDMDSFIRDFYRYIEKKRSVSKIRKLLRKLLVRK